MPPKIKITNEAIIETAMTIIRENGIDSLNAREIARLLGCSIQPIFRNFKSMDKLKEALCERAEMIHSEYMAKGLAAHVIPFLGMGLAYIEFARKEQNLYRFLFMSGEVKSMSFLQMIQQKENQEIVELISQMTGLPSRKAEELFVDIWLVVQGIASLVANNDFAVSEEQIEKILKDSFLGFRHQLSQ